MKPFKLQMSKLKGMVDDDITKNNDSSPLSSSTHHPIVPPLNITPKHSPRSANEAISTMSPRNITTTPSPRNTTIMSPRSRLPLIPTLPSIDEDKPLISPRSKEDLFSVLTKFQNASIPNPIMRPTSGLSRSTPPSPRLNLSPRLTTPPKTSTSRPPSPRPMRSPLEDEIITFPSPSQAALSPHTPKHSPPCISPRNSPSHSPVLATIEEDETLKRPTTYMTPTTTTSTTALSLSRIRGSSAPPTVSEYSYNPTNYLSLSPRTHSPRYSTTLTSPRTITSPRTFRYSAEFVSHASPIHLSPPTPSHSPPLSLPALPQSQNKSQDLILYPLAEIPELPEEA